MAVHLSLALFVAIGLLWYLPVPPRYLTPDTIDNLEFAACLDRALAGLDPGPCHGADHWSPGLPFLLALLSRAGLSMGVAVRLLALGSAALMPVPVYHLARAIAGRTAGLFAAALTVPCVVLRVYALLPDARVPALLLVFTGYALLAQALVTGKARFTLLAGAAAGGVMLLRPEGKLTLVVLLAAAVAGGWLEPGEGSRLRTPLTSLLRTRLLAAVRAGLTLLAGALAVMLPALAALHRLTGRLSLEPRSWELPVVGWMAYYPLKIFIPLFDLGAQPTPLRERFRDALAEGRLEVSFADRAAILGQQLGERLQRLIEATVQSATPELLLLAVAGGVWLLRQTGGRARFLAWLLTLAPLVALAPLPHTVNPRMPECNLLFVPVTLAVMGGIALAAAFRVVASRRRALALLLAMALLLGWTARGAAGYRHLLQARGGTLFESNPIVSRAARWLELHSAPGETVRTSFAGAVVAMLAGRERLPWPSAWEIPAWLEQEPQPLVVVTSIDLTDDPLAVQEWLKARPSLRLLYHDEGPGGWIAVLGPASRDR